MKSKGKIRVGVIFGGRSGEHEVSLMSARSVLATLDPQKYTIVQIGVNRNGTWLVGENVLEDMEKGSQKRLTPATLLADPTWQGLYSFKTIQQGDIINHFSDLDVVFPLIHGTFGEDGTLQGLLEMANVAYVGAGVLASSLGMDKGVFKDVMRYKKIPMLDSLLTTRKQIENSINQVMDKSEQLAQYPLFVKPANMGSSVGVSKCNNRSDLLEGLMDAARYDRRVLIETGINAREIEVSMLGNEDPQASIPGEIIPAAEFYSYSAKYHDDQSQLLIPAPLSPEMTERVQNLAIDAYKAIDCAGMARVDFLLDKNTDKLFLNELNTIPGFTKISMFPKLWSESGVPYATLIDTLIDLAIERKAEKDNTIYSYKFIDQENSGKGN